MPVCPAKSKGPLRESERAPAENAFFSQYSHPPPPAVPWWSRSPNRASGWRTSSTPKDTFGSRAKAPGDCRGLSQRGAGPGPPAGHPSIPIITRAPVIVKFLLAGTVGPIVISVPPK